MISIFIVEFLRRTAVFAGFLAPMLLKSMVRQSPTSLRKSWIHEEQEKAIKNGPHLEIEI